MSWLEPSLTAGRPRRSSVRAVCLALSASAVFGISPASGDIYKYQNDRGTVRFTDKPMGDPWKLVWSRSTRATPDYLTSLDQAQKSQDVGAKQEKNTNPSARQKPKKNKPKPISEELQWKCFELEGKAKARCLGGEEPVLSPLTPKSDFRGFCWGSSIDEVKEREKGDLLAESGDALFYRVTIGGLTMSALFSFFEGRLTSGSYHSEEAHTNETDFIGDYNKIESLLRSKYGKPTSDEIVWKNDLFKDKRQDWGRAVAVGHLVIFATWELERTKIITTLRGDNHRIIHGVLYEEKASAKQREKDREKHSLDEL
jgi:hypothetical protein